MLSINFSDVKKWAMSTRPKFKSEITDLSWKNAFITVYIHDVLGFSFKDIELMNIQIKSED